VNLIRKGFYSLIFGLAVLVLQSNQLKAQDSIAPRKINITGYIEMYYAYDFSKPADKERPDFLYSYDRHNEINLNFGFIKANYSGNRFRMNAGIMAGTYVNSNLATEPAVVRNIYEANAGFRLTKKHNLWLDGGVMNSHIGAETPIGKDYWSLTRGIVADNSPYYETGIKLGYLNAKEKVYMALLYVNGWQRIQRVPGNTTPAFGTQLTLTPNQRWLFNWSTFIGNPNPDSNKVWRYYNDLYTTFQLNTKWAIFAGLDLGLQQMEPMSLRYNVWWTPLLLLKYAPVEKLRASARLEYYHDKQQVMIVTSTVNGFQTFGFSLNLDYQVNKYFLCRLEGRAFSSKDEIFELNNLPSKENYCISAAIVLSL
jgi:hypothetical protein